MNESDMDPAPVVFAFRVGYRHVNTRSQNDVENALTGEIREHIYTKLSQITSLWINIVSLHYKYLIP